MSNAAQKVSRGAEPDPLMSALNALTTQLGGTNYTPNMAATSWGPDRTLPNSMQVRSPSAGPTPPIPMPEANPMFHSQSPLELDLASLFRSAMMPNAPELPPPPMMAMGEEPPALNPPLPAKKPAAKKPPAKPERTQGKGGPSTEPKRVAPPPTKKRALASR
jgi:hypothetical protein